MTEHEIIFDACESFNEASNENCLHCKFCRMTTRGRLLRERDFVCVLNPPSNDEHGNVKYTFIDVSEISGCSHFDLVDKTTVEQRTKALRKMRVELNKLKGVK